MSDVIEVQVKRGRGRPRTKPLQAKIPGRKRGRPKKTETLFREQGFKVVRVKPEVFEAALLNHSNVEEGLNFEQIKKELLAQSDAKGFLEIYDNYFKDVVTNEYFYYKPEMLFATGIVGPEASTPVLEEWKAVNLSKMEALLNPPAPVAETSAPEVPTY